LTSQDGCDSTITLDVIFQDTVRYISQIELCQGDSLLINGQWIYEDGNFTVLSTTSNGCDSIASIIIDLIPQVGIFDTINLCQGDSVFINNNWYFDAQDVTYFDLNSFCPISVTSTIESLPSYSFIDNISICPNDSIFYKGNWISEDGSFSFNYKTNLGCDSVFILNTVQIPFPDEPISMVDCDSGFYELTVDTDTNWSFVWSNGSLSNPTIYIDDTAASILYTHNDAGCLVNYNIDLPSIPFDGEVPFFGDTIVYPGKPLKYLVDLDGNFWSLDWYQDDKLSCEGCFEHMIQTQSASEIDLIFTHISGCVYYRNLSIGIDASQDIYIPNIFAPESTSGNDKWKVYIPECFMIEMVRIYDRWGNLVYTIENPSVIEWDGTYRGRYLEQGVYSYLITYTDPVFAQKIKSGDVTLIR
jgi:gliding motility-associated-like protein